MLTWHCNKHFIRSNFQSFTRKEHNEKFKKSKATRIQNPLSYNILRWWTSSSTPSRHESCLSIENLIVAATMTWSNIDDTWRIKFLQKVHLRELKKNIENYFFSQLHFMGCFRGYQTPLFCNVAVIAYCYSILWL